MNTFFGDHRILIKQLEKQRKELVQALKQAISLVDSIPGNQIIVGVWASLLRRIEEEQS